MIVDKRPNNISKKTLEILSFICYNVSIVSMLVSLVGMVVEADTLAFCSLTIGIFTVVFARLIEIEVQYREK